MKFRSVLGVFLSTVISFACTSQDHKSGSSHAESIEAATVKRSHEFEGFETDAVLGVGREIVIKAPTAGAVGDFFVDTAKTVEEGEDLLTLDPRELELDLAAKRNALRLAQAELDLTANAPPPTERPAEETPPPPPDGQADDQAPANNAGESNRPVENAGILQTRIETLQSEVEALEFRLGKTKVAAPFAGTLTPITSLYIGQALKEGEDLYRLVSTTPLRLRALVPLEYGGFLKEGMPLAFIPYSNPGETVTGSVESLSPYAKNNSLFEMTGIVDNTKRSLKDGQKGSVHIQTSKEADVLTVPRTAIARPETRPESDAKAKGRGPFVFLIQDERVSIQPVKLGPVYGDSIAIKEGLDEGDTVAASNLDFLSEGERVKIRQAAPVAPPPPPPAPPPVISPTPS